MTIQFIMEISMHIVCSFIVTALKPCLLAFYRCAKTPWPRQHLILVTHLQFRRLAHHGRKHGSVQAVMLLDRKSTAGHTEWSFRKRPQNQPHSGPLPTGGMIQIKGMFSRPKVCKLTRKSELLALVVSKYIFTTS